MWMRKLIPWLVCVVLLVVAAGLLPVVPLAQPETVSMQTLADEIKDGQITKITIADEVLHVERVDGSRVVVNKEREKSLGEALSGLGITLEMMDGVEIKVMAPGTSR